MKRTFSILMVLCMLFSLVACGGDPATGSGSAGTSSAGSSSAGTSSAGTSAGTSTPETPAEPKVLNLYVTSASSTACILSTTSSADSPLAARISSSLYGYLPVDGKSALSCVLADGEPVDVNGDGLTWNITISDKAKWENGEAMNADTFVYTLQKALDPKLVFVRGAKVASEYIVIKNASAYYTQGTTGVAVAWEDVGVKKVDEMTIQITVETATNATKVMRHFATAYTVPLYQPLFDQCLSADGTTTTYGTAKEYIMACGPFTMTEWTHGAVREFERNENYILSDLIKLDRIVETVIEDDNTALQMYEQGQLDQVELTTSALETYGDDPRVKTVPTRYVRTIEICDTNTDNPLLGNKNFRKALFYACDRVTLAKVLGASACTTYVPRSSVAYSDGTTYQEVANNAGIYPENYGYDTALAVEYFETALKEVGVTSAEVEFMIAEGYEEIAEFLQESWPKVFGEDRFKATITVQPSSAASTQRKSWTSNPNAYELTLTGWGRAATDFNPLEGIATFIGSYTGRNAPHFNDEAVALYEEGQKYLLDEQKIAEITMDIEEILLDECKAIPLYYTCSFQLISDRVKLAVDSYDSQIGWGLQFADIIQ